jgi:hypothetical protein
MKEDKNVLAQIRAASKECSCSSSGCPYVGLISQFRCFTVLTSVKRAGSAVQL